MTLGGCAKADAVPGSPRIHTPVRYKDFGELSVEGGEPYYVSFPFENVGAAPLQILGIRKSCGCADADVTKATLEPGEQAEVKVEVVPTQAAEEEHHAVTLFTNDARRPQVKLRFSWQAVAPLELHPDRIDFGTLVSGQTVEKTVEVATRESARFPDCSTLSIETSPSSVTADWENGDAGGTQPGADRLLIRVQAGEVRGEALGRVRVTLKGCWRDRLVIPLRWRVRDVVEASPAALFLGTGQSGDVVSGHVVIAAAKDQQLELREVRFESARLHAKPVTKQIAQHSAMVTVETELPEEASAYDGKLVITCVKPIERTIVVPTSAYVTAGGT